MAAATDRGRGRTLVGGGGIAAIAAGAAAYVSYRRRRAAPSSYATLADPSSGGLEHGELRSETAEDPKPPTAADRAPASAQPAGGDDS